MKNLITLFVIFIFIQSNAQPPVIQWQYTYGGNSDDKFNSICLTPDGGFAIIGYTYSTSGIISNNHGGPDSWILKLDSAGQYQWNKCFGGIGSENGYSIKCTSDSGFIIACDADHDDGQVIGVHGSRSDFWIIKTDNQGNILWKKCYGGSDDDKPRDIIPTTDSGYFVIGYSESNDYDVMGNHGNGDVWALKLYHDSVIQWAKALGGSSFDEGISCIETNNSEIIFTAVTTSDDGNVSGLHSLTSGDVWVVKLDSSGHIIWQKCFGGTGIDSPGRIFADKNGGFFIASPTSSNDGDVSGNHGMDDFWLAKADSNGLILWQKCYGGSYFEEGYTLSKTNDGGIIMAGTAETDNGTISGTHGMLDFWIVKVDSMGTFEWAKALGGTENETPTSIFQTQDGGYVVAGYSASVNGDITINHGTIDGWIVKLSPPGLSVPETENNLMDLTLIQHNDQLTARFYSKNYQTVTLNLLNIEGKEIYSENFLVNEGINYKELNCLSFGTGMYFIEVRGKNFIQREKAVLSY